MKKLIIVIAAALQVTPTSAAETTLTLACQGTVTIDDWSLKRAGQFQDPKKETYSTGMTIDLTARTVQLFGSQYPFKITDINAATIVFSDSEKQTAILGSIDRVTGDLEATITHWLDGQRRDISNEQFYEMKCKPSQRMF